MPAAGRPSLFFLIALALGLILLAWVAWEAVSHPVKAPPKKTGTASAITSVRA